MNATSASRFTQPLGSMGMLISLALVFGGSTALAEGLSGYAAAADITSGLIGTFSDADLQQLEDASAAAARLSEAIKPEAEFTASARVWTAAKNATATATDAEADLFPFSGKVLPLLVTRPVSPPPVAGVVDTMRPGLIQPVGVPALTIRSRTPSERAAR